MTLSGLLLKELSDGQTEAGLARAIGIAEAQVKAILDGMVPTDLSTWKRFAAYFRMDVDMLRFGDLHATSASDLLRADPPVDLGQYRTVPLLSWSDLADQLGDRAVAMSTRTIETDVAGERVFAVRLEDDSMQPLFRSGEIIFVNPDMAWQADDYVVVRTAEGARRPILRQVKKVGRQYVLHAFNRRYPNAPLMEQDVIVGRVVRLRLNL